MDTSSTTGAHTAGEKLFILLLAVSVAAIVALYFPPGSHLPYEEGVSYKAIAEGRIDNAYFIYARRVAHPGMVRALTQTFKMSTENGFRITAVLALLVFVGSLQWFTLGQKPLA